LNIETKLGRVDRIASGIGGLGLILYASFGTIDALWVRIVTIAFGVIFLAGFIGGT